MRVSILSFFSITEHLVENIFRWSRPDSPMTSKVTVKNLLAAISYKSETSDLTGSVSSSSAGLALDDGPSAFRGSPAEDLGSTAFSISFFGGGTAEALSL